MTISPLRRPAGWSALPFLVVATLGLALLLSAGTSPAAAQPSPSQVADEVASTGAYVAQRVDDDVRSAIDEANQAGIGVVLLADDTNAPDLAREVLQDLPRSSYRTVLVVSFSSAGAASTALDDIGTILRGDGPTFRALEQGRNADGIRQFTDEVTGVAPSAPVPAPDASSGDDGDGGGGFPWAALLVVIAIAGVGYGGYRLYQGRQRDARAAAELEAERASLGEQLRNNADRVINLGDAVLARGERELVDLYARASETYRDVSHRLDGAGSLDAVRQLDQRMDEAEWQFEVIEARLAGRPSPPRPSSSSGGDRPSSGDERSAGTRGGTGPGPAAPDPAGDKGSPRSDRPDPGLPDDAPVLGPNESLFGTTLPSAPTSAAGRILRPGRRRGRYGRRR